tara:strand:- start:534 stop:968 length:435 start_codon:yes stop_codon:yes gene_type:complete
MTVYCKSILKYLTHYNKQTEGVHSNLLEDGARGPVCAGPSKSFKVKQLGASCSRGSDFYAASVWQDDQCEYVCGGYFVCSAGGGAEHLLYMQAHLAKAPAQRCQVLPYHMRTGLVLGGIQGHSPKYGGDRPTGGGRQPGRARGE